MAAYFVTRHPGARDWAARRGIAAERVDHLDIARIRPGDSVMGTLPVHLAAAVNAAGARYLHLELDIPASHRGADLSADDMDRFGARLMEYRVTPVPPPDAGEEH